MSDFKKEDKNLQSFKVVLMGDSGVGKTSIVNRYTKDTFEEDTTFWKEFLASSSPPFTFSSGGGEKIEFKSYNKNLLKYIFSKPSANKLYSMFVNDKKDIVYHQILSKRRVKKINYQTLAFYMFYRKNLNKLGFSLVIS